MKTRLTSWRVIYTDRCELIESANSLSDFLPVKGAQPIAVFFRDGATYHPVSQTALKRIMPTRTSCRQLYNRNYNRQRADLMRRIQAAKQGAVA